MFPRKHDTHTDEQWLRRASMRIYLVVGVMASGIRDSEDPRDEEDICMGLKLGWLSCISNLRKSSPEGLS